MKTLDTPYPSELCLEDLCKCIGFVLPELGTLTTCSCCGKPAIGLTGAVEKGEVAYIFRLCTDCMANKSLFPTNEDWLMGPESFVRIPLNDRDRRHFVILIVKLIANKLERMNRLPAVVGPLNLFRKLGLLVYRQGKRVKLQPMPFPYKDGDPPIITGRHAIDTEATMRSIKAGKTEILVADNGNFVVLSHDDKRLRGRR